MGGIKLESEQGRGPKQATLSGSKQEEQRFYCACGNQVLFLCIQEDLSKMGLKSYIHCLHRHLCRGIILMSCPEQTLLPDSVHVSMTTGHIAAGVFEVTT